MKIPLCKTNLDKKDISVIVKSLKSGWLTHGSKNIEFEKNFNNLFGTKYSISMNSCTSALECSIKSQNIKGEIIVPSWTWVSTINAVLNCGCKPVFGDVDINSRNLTAKFIEERITKKTKAIIPVHLYGQAANMEEIMEVCKKYKIKLIEDSAETLGAKFKNKYTGTFGVGVRSFFPTKNITTAEGGMLTTNDKHVYLYTKKLIAHGILKKNKSLPWKREAELPGHNFRLPNHLAALGNNQLNKLKKFNFKRNLIAKKYDNFFKSYPKIFKVQEVNKDFTHSYQMYTVQIIDKNRNNFIKFLRKNNIEASVHFDPPLHRQRYCAQFKKHHLPNTDVLSRTIVTMPMFPSLTNNQLGYVFKIIRKWILEVNGINLYV